MSNEYTRNLRDAAFSVTKAMPAANANANMPTIDLGQKTAGEIEELQVELVIPALPALVQSKTATFQLRESADDSNWAATDPLIQTVLTGGSGNGVAGKTVRFRLPPTIKRYITVNIAVQSSGGDNTAAVVGLNLLF